MLIDFCILLDGDPTKEAFKGLTIVQELKKD
jgi:hypothetical protein